MPTPVTTQTHASVAPNKLQNTFIDISPNPTAGIVTIHNAPKDILNIIVSNVLAESVMELKNLSSTDFTIDLSKLVSGAYYIRFITARSTVTKMVVRE
jgi:hypothetical protein